MKIWLCVVLMLLCVQAAWAQAPAEEPPYPETGPAHAKWAVLEAGANGYILRSPIEVCYYDPTKPWVRTHFEMAVMTARALMTLYPQFGGNARSDNQLLRQRLQHSPAMQTALYHLLQEFGPQFQQFGIEAQDITQIQEELLAQGAKKQQQYTSIPLGDAVYDDVRFLRKIGLAPLHSGERDFAVKQVMSRYEFAVVVARIVQAGTPNKENESSQLTQSASQWSLPLNGLGTQSTPEIKAALIRLIRRFSPELYDLGFSPERLILVQRELGITSPFKETPFNDIPPGHWAYNAVEHLRLSGIIMGDAPR